MILYGQPLLISVENSPTGTWLIVSGEVDIATATQLRDEVLPRLAAAKTLWLDLGDVTFMDSSGLHVLLASRRRAALLGSRLVIGRTSTAVDRLLEVTGTTALFARGVNPADTDPADASGHIRRRAWFVDPP